MNRPVPGKRYDLLARADGVTLGRWTCDLCNTRDGPEQQSDVATMNIPTRGAFVRRGSGGTELVDPLTCSFSNVGEVWCTRHPEPCRDTGIYVTFRAGTLEAPFCVPYRRISATEWLDWHRLAAAAGTLGHVAAIDATRLLVERQLSAPPTPSCPELVRAARARVARGDIRSVEALAAELGVSVFTLCRAFRRAGGVTAHACVDQVRTARAAEAILAGADDLAALALELGFSHHSHLTLRLRQRYGCTPTELRRGARM